MIPEYMKRALYYLINGGYDRQNDNKAFMRLMSRPKKKRSGFTRPKKSTLNYRQQNKKKRKQAKQHRQHRNNRKRR